MAEALVHCLKLSGRSLDAASLVAGLPVPKDGRLTPELAIRSAERHGQRARLVRRRLSDLPQSLLPAVLFLSGRDAC
ncbi:MAG: type I secretion system permease/ATPase, partial [Pseudomonadota bacterium]